MRIFFFSSILLLLCGCDNGYVVGSKRIVADTREVAPFSGIAFSGKGILLIKQGFKSGLIVQADDNLIDFIRSEVKDGILYLSVDEEKEVFRPSREFFYYATVRDLISLDLKGEGAATTLQEITGDNVDIRIHGDFRVKMAIEAQELAVDLQGAVTAEFKGEVDVQRIALKGSNTYMALELRSKKAEIRASGAGSVAVNVTEHLLIEILGETAIRYKGSPEIEIMSRGKGKIQHVSP